ncbi:MAG: hypothetical protein K1X74_05445 [Pirellulales bacterium]|nr:hypothetical protein [Pirellulales bacterium]
MSLTAGLHAGLLRAQETPPAALADGATAKGALAERLQKLIAQLGDDSFFVREKAQEELAAIGLEAFDALTLAEGSEDIEIAARVRYLLRRMQVELTLADDPAEVKNLLDGFETADENNREERLKKLATMANDVGLPALCRLTRFLKSDAWSKRAALAIMSQGLAETSIENMVTGQPFDETAARAVAEATPPQADPIAAFDDARWDARAQTITSSLGSSPRPAANWLRAYVRMRKEMPEAIVQWQPLLVTEIENLERFPQLTAPEIVKTLLRQHVAWMEATGRQAEAEETTLRMVPLAGSEPGSLIELLHWLVAHRAWRAVDATAERFAASIQQQPHLAYTLAFAREAQGQREAADKLAARTLELNPKDLGEHYSVTMFLHNRGWTRWCEAEYRKIIEIGPPDNVYVMRAEQELAEILHDRGDDAGAAEAAAAINAVFEAQIAAGQDVPASTNYDPDVTKRRMYFFRGADAVAKKDWARAMAEFEAALPLDPTDADVLIGLFHLPDLPEAKRNEIRTRVREAAEIFRNQIQRDPEVPTPYNQLAWLISNTEGDANEAIQASKKSLELMPNAPGYLDTLGRCYYFAGDLEQAVATQTKAVRLEPQTGLMSKQLAFFQQALAERRAKAGQP